MTTLPSIKIRINDQGSLTGDFDEYDSLVKAYDKVGEEMEHEDRNRFDLIMPDGTEHIEITTEETLKLLKELSPWKKITT